MFFKIFSSFSRAKCRRHADCKLLWKLVCKIWPVKYLLSVGSLVFCYPWVPALKITNFRGNGDINEVKLWLLVALLLLVLPFGNSHLVTTGYKRKKTAEWWKCVYWSKWVLSSFVLRMLAQSKQGATYHWVGVTGPGWRTSSLWYFGMHLLFIHPTRTGAEARSPPQSSPPPFLLLLFNVKAWMNGCSWPIKRPALLKGLGDWDSTRPSHL